jgi:hypothetical protein
MARAPFEIGSLVNVIRTRHGWHDGALACRVVARYQRPTGTWHYVVRDQDGQDHEIDHTRDLRPATGA